MPNRINNNQASLINKSRKQVKSTFSSNLLKVAVGILSLAGSVKSQHLRGSYKQDKDPQSRQLIEISNATQCEKLATEIDSKLTRGTAKCDANHNFFYLNNVCEGGTAIVNCSMEVEAIHYVSDNFVQTSSEALECARMTELTGQFSGCQISEANMFFNPTPSPTYTGCSQDMSKLLISEIVQLGIQQLANLTANVNGDYCEFEFKNICPKSQKVRIDANIPREDKSEYPLTLTFTKDYNGGSSSGIIERKELYNLFNNTDYGGILESCLYDISPTSLPASAPTPFPWIIPTNVPTGNPTIKYNPSSTPSKSPTSSPTPSLIESETAKPTIAERKTYDVYAIEVLTAARDIFKRSCEKLGIPLDSIEGGRYAYTKPSNETTATERKISFSPNIFGTCDVIIHDNNRTIDTSCLEEFINELLQNPTFMNFLSGVKEKQCVDKKKALEEFFYRALQAVVGVGLIGGVSYCFSRNRKNLPNLGRINNLVPNPNNLCRFVVDSVQRWAHQQFNQRNRFPSQRRAPRRSELTSRTHNQI